MPHNQNIDGFRIIAHNPNVNDISERIKDMEKLKNFTYKVYLGPNRVCESYITESDFEKQCAVYFDRYYKELIKEGPAILPWKVEDCSKNFENLILHMHCWCKKTNISPNIQRLVLHTFPILKHLYWHGFNENVIKNYLQIDKIPDELSTVIYNPQGGIIFLVHEAKSEKLATDIASVIDYLKLFILLFHNVLKESKMKLIPLVVINKNVDPDDTDCCLCMKHVLSEKELADFSNWLKRKENYFEAEYRERIEEQLSKRFLAKVMGVFAATSIHPNYIPMFIDKQNDHQQMEHVKVLLTPAQINIYYSQDKHMIIKGGFGCGKSIIASAMLGKIANSLKNDEKLFHICYDRRSELLNENVKKNEKVKIYHNKKGDMLSTIIHKIAELNRSENINVVVDEYDGEDLDESEAEKLNNIFNILLKKAYVVLIAQPIEKNRIINKVYQTKNRFDLLEKTMKQHYLKLNMRNSKEIYELVEATKEVLKEKQTVFYDSKPDSKNDKMGDEIKKKKESKESSEENLRRPSRPSKQKYHQKLGAEPKVIIKGHSLENYSNTKMGLDGAEAIKGLPMVTREENKDGSKDESKQQSVKNYGDSSMGLEDAQAIIGSPKGNDADGNSIVSSFTYEEVKGIGHKIETERPLLFELGDKKEFEKSLSLVAIFKELLIKNSRHVVLHFDTDTAIPSALRFAYDRHFNNIKISTNYKEFKSSSVLVCSYRTFRGLEYSRVTILIDRDIYFQQHYFVEMLTRCTSQLSVIVLQNSLALDYVLEKWKTKKLINQWKTEISLKDNQSEDYDFFCDNDQKMVTGKFRSIYYKRLEEEFKLSSIKNDTTAKNMELEARKTINQKR